MEHSLCMDYVEIRNASDFANTGMSVQDAEFVEKDYLKNK
uniref:Uncharacterized protein n=1 Tax=Romanomermis culicivorax TaxID=13658 RepID=A0A915L3E7_ROMCU